MNSCQSRTSPPVTSATATPVRSPPARVNLAIGSDRHAYLHPGRPPRRRGPPPGAAPLPRY